MDLELYAKLEKTYVDVAMKATAGMDAPWRVKTVEYVLARASAKARMIPPDVEEERSHSREWFGKRISSVTQKLKWKRYKILGPDFASVLTTSEIIEIFPDKGQEILNMERELADLKQQLNMECLREIHEEAEKDGERLMVTMRRGDSSMFHKTAKVQKVIVNDTPKKIVHEGITYTGKDVLRVFALSAAQQSGEEVNLPEKIPELTREYVQKKESVYMKRMVAKYDDSYFVPLTKEKYYDVLSLLPNNKSPDVYGVQCEHLKYASDQTNDYVRYLINCILENIEQFSDYMISLNLAQYIHKGKNRDPMIMKSYRRIQIGCLIHKYIQRLVEEQCTEVVSEHQVRNQWGFSRGVSFLQCPVTRECLSKLSIEKQMPLYCVAADVQSAFSRTNRVCQLYECQLQGEHGKLFLFTCGFFENTDVILTANGMYSERFSEWLGACQGGIRSPGAWKVYSVPLSLMIENSGIGARFYGLDFGLALVADDSLALTTSEHRFNLMSRIYERYAKEYNIIYEYSKLELNLWGVKDAEKKCDGLKFGGYTHKVSKESTHEAKHNFMHHF